MAMFKDFTFDGENSRDYGVYISGDAVYDAPERAMDMVQIPGRNGALALDNGYYKNIDVTYPAGCFANDQADFAAKLSRIRNMLASRHRYCRLEDAYHPDHFRMALYKSGLDVAPVARNKAGRFNIIFDAKPQRFLKSGEVVQELDADAPPTTSYGPADVVTFEGEPGDAIVHGQWPLEPIQDLHGYGNPWPAGGGKNKLPMTLADIKAKNTVGTWTGNSYTLSGVTFVVETNASGAVTAIKVSGTASAVVGFNLADTPETTAEMVLNGCPAGGSNGTYRIVYSNTASDTGSGATIPSGTPSSYAYIRITSDYAISGTLTFYPMLRLSTEADATFAPYSNICPITGFTGAEITDRGVNLWDEEWEVGSLNSTGNPISSTERIRSKNYIPVVGGQSYYCASPYSQAFNIWCEAFDANKNIISNAFGGTYYKNIGNVVFAVPQNAAYIKFVAIDRTYHNDISINYPSTDTAYHASVGTTHDITWTDEAGTVYGGNIAYLGGNSWRLTVTDAGKAFNGTETVNVSADRFALDMGFYCPTDDSIHVISSHFIKRNNSSVYAHRNDAGYIGICTYSTMAYLVDNVNFASKDTDAFKAYLAAQYANGTPLTIVSKRTTPQVYDLSSNELQALIGTNNIFSDTGTMTITVQSPYELENPTLYPSKPLIRVYGSGTIQVNDITITVAEHSGYIDIDCDMMDCHRGADSMNQYVSFSGNDFPELQPGINRILLNGPDKVEITPRWWEL